MTIVSWILAAVAALAIVSLLAFDRREPGFDGRIPDPEDVPAAVTSDTD
jgi:hypothetical protein